MADHDELVRRLQQMETASPDIGHETRATNLAVDPRDVAADDLPLGRLGGKDAGKPEIGMVIRHGFHETRLVVSW